MFAATCAVLLFSLPVAPLDGAQTAGWVIPSRADLVAPPRIARGDDGRFFVVSAVVDGIDVVASRDATCTTFGEPVRAAQRADIMAGGRRGPRMAVAGKKGGQTLVVAAITQRTKSATGDYGGDLLAWRSTDAGATWSGPQHVSDVPGCAAEGLFDLAGLADGRFVLVWLDVREKGTRLCADFSSDGAAWGEDVVAYASPGGSICECCHPAITATTDGGAVVAFRNSLKGDRDVWTMRLDRSSRKFDAANRSGKRPWKVAVCPMAGPAVDVSGGEVVAAWRRERNVFVVVGGAEEKDLGEGTEPQVVAGKAGVHVVWIAQAGLVHLAPGAAEARVLARDAAWPSAIPSGETGSAVTWLDREIRRGRVWVFP